MGQRATSPISFPDLTEHIWRAPLVPVALALTLGVLLDRYVRMPLPFSLGLSLAAGGSWIVNAHRASQSLSLLCLFAVCAGVGAAYHHAAREEIADNDVRQLAAPDPKPVRLRGIVGSEPNYIGASGEHPLRSFSSSAKTRFLLRANQLKTSVDWLDVSGLVQVTLEAKIHPLHPGDRVEIAGRLSLPRAPANPGESDYPAFLRDQGIGTMVFVPPSTEGITLLAEGWPRTLFGWLAVIRAWGQGVIARNLPEKQVPVAGALLLGDDSGMTRDDWDKYARTGVIHVLAISGQHLVVLGCFLSALIRACGISNRRGVLFVAIFLVLYALMTGGRPPVMRSAWAMVACCGGVWLLRPTLPANTFALGWIGVIVVNPMDIFNIGCQLSFLAVAILFWGTKSSVYSSAFLAWVPFLSRREGAEPELQRLVDESRPLLVLHLIRLKRWLFDFYLVNATVWLAVTPLVAGTLHMISPVALLIGPPMVVLTSIALISGFLMLLAAPLGIAAFFAWPTGLSLAACESVVDWAMALPCSCVYLPDLPAWWLWTFYLMLFAYLTVGWLGRHSSVFACFSLVWISLAGAIVLGFFNVHAFRCAFLAVGHGGCTVLETADGKVMLYDAGAMDGPEVTRRSIAPYLWRRGIRRIDELFISHADLDHFNGVIALLERCAVKRVSLTPSFSQRLSDGVRATLAELDRRGIPTRVIKAGDILDKISIPMSVLHPPLRGPEGNENARSLVLHLRQEDLSILLTGDLQGQGLERVLAQAPIPVDILMAPHHGSRTSNKAELARWARPKVVISSQGAPRGNVKVANPYEALGARYLSTWNDGAVTVRQEQGSWVVETYLSKKEFSLFFP
jgi:competence protein ComEC